MKKSRLLSVVRAGALALITLAFSNFVAAATVTWYVQGVTFDDGGTASGSFVYDADTDSYTSINITTTAGSALGGTSYGYDNINSPIPSDDSFLIMVPDSFPTDQTGNGVLALTFASALTNSGGTINITPGNTPPPFVPPFSFEGVCSNPECGASSTDRIITGGQVSTVPVPAAVWLFGSGLIGLVGIARRKKA